MTLRYIFSFVGGFLAMFAHVFLALRSADFFATQRWGNAISAGLMFGHLVAFAALFGRDLPLVKRETWSFSARFILALLGAWAFGTLAWWAHSTFFLAIVPPDWGVLLLGGFSLSLGFIACGLGNRKLPAVMLSSLLSIVAIFAPIYWTNQQFLVTRSSPNPAQALLYFQPDNPEHVWLIGLPFVLMVALTSYAPLLWQAIRS